MNSIGACERTQRETLKLAACSEQTC